MEEFLRRRQTEGALQAFGAWSRPEDFDSVAFVEALRSGAEGERLTDGPDRAVSDRGASRMPAPSAPGASSDLRLKGFPLGGGLDGAH